LWGGVPVVPFVGVAGGPVFSEEGVAFSIGFGVGVGTPFGISYQPGEFTPGSSAGLSLINRWDITTGEITDVQLFGAGLNWSYTTPAMSWEDFGEMKQQAEHPLSGMSGIAAPEPMLETIEEKPHF